MLRRYIIKIAELKVSSPAYTQSETIEFAIVKPGDEAATEALAAKYMQEIAAYLSRHVPELERREIQGHVFNRINPALAFLAKKQPVLIFAPPGFFLGHLQNRTEPIAQVPRLSLIHI